MRFFVQAASSESDAGLGRHRSAMDGRMLARTRYDGGRMSHPPGPRRRHRALVVVAVACASVAGLGVLARVASSHEDPPFTMPGPAREGPVADRSELNASCIGCHASIGTQWAASLHRHAWDDADFQHAAKREGRAFCRGCHAPESDPAEAPTHAAAGLGVGCVTCHVPRDASLPAGAVLAGAGATSRRAPHGIVRTAAFDGSEACAGCHEFESPRTRGLAMQRTVSEHARSALASRTCIDCHMPRGEDGRRAHGFAASRDPEMIAAAISVDAERPRADRVVLRLSPAEVGHAFPTGDLFRRLRVQAGVERDGGLVVLDERMLGRWFQDRLEHGLVPRRIEVRDDRPGGATDVVTVRLSVRDAAAEPISWRVVYERVDHPVGRDAPLIFGAIVAAEGRLDP